MGCDHLRHSTEPEAYLFIHRASLRCLAAEVVLSEGQSLFEKILCTRMLGLVCSGSFVWSVHHTVATGKKPDFK